MSFAISLSQALQLTRYHLRMPSRAMARHLGLCPCCYKAFELGLRAMSDAVRDQVLARLPFLSEVLVEDLVETRLPPTIRAMKNQMAYLQVLPSERADLEWARIRMELQWLDLETPAETLGES